MKALKLCLFAVICALLAGCGTTRSISNSSYREDHVAFWGPRVNNSGSDYRGELSEFDVLGITRGQMTTEQDIQRALDNSKTVTLNRNSSILLIQSGAMFPDAPMVAELSKYFRVNTFSGVPPAFRDSSGNITENRDPQSFAQSLRLAAARGGNDVILCYWGILESETENMATKTVSWVPVMNWIVPDEKQHMRIRLKLAVIDVRSSSWSVLSPNAFDDSRVSTSPRRGVKDQQQVETLKAKAYEASVKSLVERYSSIAMAH